jgi:glutathione synthase
MDVLFIIDPLETLNAAHDTSVALMEAAQLAGRRVHTSTVGDLAVLEGRPVARAAAIRLRPAVLADGKWIADADWYSASPVQEIDLNAMSAIFMRTDPPVDASYLRATFILDLVEPTHTLVINSPSGLRDANEKMFGLQFPELGPPTIVTADRDRIRDVVDRWSTAVLKPIEGMAGRGIMLLNSGDPNLNSILDTATTRGRDHVVIQQYLPAVDHQGDRRVIVLGGEPIGAICRIALGGAEFRCNMATGAAVVADRVTARDREICRVLRPELLRHGLYFVGIDVISGYLTEINVTSPTGVREIDALCGTTLAADIIDWVAQACATRVVAG